MIRQIASPVLRLVGLALILAFSGCVPLATDVRKEGFHSFDRSFASLDESPNLNEVVDLGGVKVHVVGHRQYFNYKKAAAYGSPVVGYATSNNEIWLFGRLMKGKVVVNYVYLLNPNYAPETILFFILIITGTCAAFLRKHVYTPYFNPRLRWWETAARYRIVLDTAILTEGGAQPCKTVDISETGCFLEARISLAEGVSVWLKIRCKGVEINCLGRVVRRAGSAEIIRGYGIMFQGMSAEAKELLRKLIFSLERLDREERKDLISTAEIPTDLWRRNYTMLSRWAFRVKSSISHTLSYKPKHIEHSA